MSTRGTPDADAFWAFSLRTYGRDGVEAACLDLQDEHGFDVNLILLCLWIAETELGALAPEVLDKLRSAIAPWMIDVVEPLRAVRRVLKTPLPLGASPGEAEPCRQMVKAVELDAERIVQRILVRALAGQPATAHGSAHDAARASLAAYAGLLPRSNAEPALERLQAAIF